MESLADPILVTPRHAQGVVADYLRLDWEPVDGADRYTVEIAADTAFSDVVVTFDAGRTTEATLAGLVPPDGQTYFWRVLARAGDVTSPGHRVESFTARTAEDAAVERAQGSDVDRREDLGPAVELVGSAATTATAEATGQPDTAWADELTSEGVEPEGIASGQILGIAVAILVSLFVISGVVFSWNRTVADAALQAASSDALSEGTPRYPVLAQSRSEAEKLLTSYEAVDGAQGVYRIPIDQAIQILSNRSAVAAAGADSTAGFAIP